MTRSTPSGALPTLTEMNETASTSSGTTSHQGRLYDTQNVFRRSPWKFPSLNEHSVRPESSLGMSVPTPSSGLRVSRTIATAANQQHSPLPRTSPGTAARNVGFGHCCGMPITRATCRGRSDGLDVRRTRSASLVARVHLEATPVLQPCQDPKRQRWKCTERTTETTHQLRYFERVKEQPPTIPGYRCTDVYALRRERGTRNRTLHAYVTEGSQL